MDSEQKALPAPKKRGSAALTAFAIVGFIALLLIGVLLAIYSARLTSKITDSLSWSSLFHKKSQPALQVVSTTTMPIIMPTPVATTTEPVTVVETTHTTPTYPSGSYTVVNPPAHLYGNPDLYIAITDTGYLAVKGSTSSFVSSPVIPQGAQGAVKFSVTNIGSNQSGSWTFAADLPSQRFMSPLQQSLLPGETNDLILGFDHPYNNVTQVITVYADPSNTVFEANEQNNVASRQVQM